MKKVYHSKKRRPVFRMLSRVLNHCKSFEELEELWEIQMMLLLPDERKYFYIHVYSTYQYSLPHDSEAYQKK